MTRKRIGLGATAAMMVVLTTSGAAIDAAPASAPTVPTHSKCSALLSLRQPGMVIDSAEFQPTKEPVQGANAPSMTGQYGKGAPIAGLPAFCRIRGALHPEAGSDIKFETWLPADGWTGSYTGANSGGLAGFINYLDLAAAVRAGHATSGSDTGHTGDSPGDGRWAKGNPQKIRDYGWRAVHLTTVAGKQLTEAYYGRKPDKSYFIGCSNGGRQGLMEAARFPDDYDGIVVGAPAVRMTDLASTFIHIQRAQSPAGAQLRKEQVSFIQSEAIRQCDALDGQIDGLLDDPRQCRFDYSNLACGNSSSSQCLAAPQIAALKQIVGGARGSGGRPLAYGFPLTGGEVGKPVAQFGWDGNLIQNFRGADGEPNFAETILENFTTPPIATVASFDFKRDGAALRKAVGGDMDATPDLTRFFARGGKMILWHGWSDATLPPQWSIDLHRDILKQSGPRARTGLQFFMMPGVQHCMGGPGADAFGQIGAAQPNDTPERSVAVALEHWVEKGRVPQSLIGRRNGILSMFAPGAAGAEKQKLHCAWPKKAVLKVGGDPDMAASYHCSGN
jgi:Tannase and feruloyl esterase